MDGRYRICKRCIMDTTDPDIVFDADGICNHCRQYDAFVKANIIPDKIERQKKLEALVGRIKADGGKKRYNCIIGVSGGVDSTYVAYKVKEMGLRPLAVHLDNGWDSELAVNNIKNILNKLGIDLYTYVIDWEEFRDLQLAFLKASTPDSEIPSDHAIIALMYNAARQNGVRHIISGHNAATEYILPSAWSHGSRDWKYIKGIQKRFGTRPLRSFPHYSLMQLLVYENILGLSFIRILDYLDYERSAAMEVLKNKLGWNYYGGKHYESLYTRFYQGYILPVKFGFDKRRAHLSTLICSGQITREAALETVKLNPYPSEELKNEDKEYVAKKLGISIEEFEQIMRLPKKEIWDYPSYEKSFSGFRKLYEWLKKQSRK